MKRCLMTRRALLGGAGASALGACVTSSQRGSARFAQLQRIAQQAIDRSVAPGIAVAIKGRDGLIYSDCRGVGEMSTGSVLGADSLFRVYSQTKAVTTVAALGLVESGDIHLDDPVADFIPGFRSTPVFAGDSPDSYHLEKQARPVTIRDLMRHTAGLIYRDDAKYPSSALYVARGVDNGAGPRVKPTDGSPPIETLADLANTIAIIPLVAQPGTRFTYGNATDVLGRVIEIASSQRLRDFLGERILTPLGMRRSMFDVGDADKPYLTAAYFGEAAARAPQPFLDVADISTLGRNSLKLADAPDGSAFAAPRAIDFGGAGLVCTTADYLRFASLLAQGGAVDGVRLLSPALFGEMTKNQLSQTALKTPELDRLGLGFGLGLATFNDPAKAPPGIPPRLRFWGGAASTMYWIDTDRQIAGVIMAQVFGGDFRAYHLELIRSFYAAL